MKPTVILPYPNPTRAPSSSPLVSTIGAAAPDYSVSGTPLRAWRFTPSVGALESIAIPVLVPYGTQALRLFAGITGEGTGSSFYLESVGRSNQSTWGAVKDAEAFPVSATIPQQSLVASTVSLAAFGFVAGQLCELDFGRDTTHAFDTITGDCLVHSLTIYWS